MNNRTAARRRALEQCIVLRFKLIELTHLLALGYEITDGYMPSRVRLEFNETRLSTLLAYTAVCLNAITDESNLDIRKLMRLLYPEEKSWMKEVWLTDVEPAMGILREYRNKTVAHADDVDKYLQTRFDYHRKRNLIGLAARGILDIARRLIQHQDANPEEFHAVAEEAILRVDLQNPNHKLNRTRLKRMGILPSGSFHKTY